MQPLQVVRRFLRLSPQSPRSQPDRSASFTPTLTRTKPSVTNWRRPWPSVKRQGLISGWHDRKIGAGDEWKGAIDKNLEEAQVFLLLVSSSFLASDYCWDVETKRAVERHDRGEAKVIPLVLRPCEWHGAPFGKLQALPKDGKAVTSWTNKDEAWTDVALGIRRAIETMKGSSA